MTVLLALSLMTAVAVTLRSREPAKVGSSR